MDEFFDAHQHQRDEAACDEHAYIQHLRSQCDATPEQFRLILLALMSEKISDALDEYSVRVQDEVETLERWYALPADPSQT